MEEYTDHQEIVDWLEALENEHDVTMRADQPVVVYLDGVGFRHVTRYLQKPFDDNFHDAMTDTARKLAHHFGLNFALTSSDEIAMVRYSKDERFSIWCGQSRDRILSSVSSLASSILSDSCKERGLRLAWHTSFAGHVCNVPSLDAASQMMLCIEQRHHKRSVSNLAHYYLGTQKESVPISELKNRLAAAGHAWEAMPKSFKHGSAIRREPSKSREMKYDIKFVSQPLFYRECLTDDIFRGNSGD